MAMSMPRRTLLVCSIVVPIAGFLVFETVEARTADAEAAAIDAEVRAFVGAYGATLADADPDGVRALYAEDARFAWFTDGVRLYESAQDVLDGLTGFGEVRFETAMTGVEVTALGDSHAAVRADFRTAAMADGAERFAFAGVLTMVVERAGDGAWRVVQGHSSTAGGPPGAGQ
jgi:uncharacterized protein (TIGR02246 family)